MYANNKTLNTLFNLSQLIWVTTSVLPFALSGHCESIRLKPHYWHFCSKLKPLLASIAQKSGFHIDCYHTLSTMVTLHTGSPKIHPSCRHEQHAYYAAALEDDDHLNSLSYKQLVHSGRGYYWREFLHTWVAAQLSWGRLVLLSLKIFSSLLPRLSLSFICKSLKL